MTAFALALVNQASVDDSEIAAFLPAASEFIAKWVAAFWPETMGSTIRAVPDGEQPGSGEVPITLAPNTTLANSLGYHNYQDGSPLGIVELDACRLYNEPWTIAATHEITELLVNPDLARFTTIEGRSYPIEVADPVTGLHFDINGVAVSNFSTPSWWGLASDTRYDAMAQVTRPLPTIPHLGWLEWSEGGTYTSAYGSDLPDAKIAYMKTRDGRRARIRKLQR